MLRLALLLLVTLLVLSGIVAAQSSSSKHVKVADYGDKWPFVAAVREGTIHCRDNSVYFKANGKLYHLNGMAASRPLAGVKAVDPTSIQADRMISNDFKVKKSTKPLLDDGLKLCK